jgi:hypothetical protein
MCLKLSGFRSQYANKVYMLCQPSLRPIRYGLASGNPDVELQSVMEFAEFTQKPIAQF